jgi:putative PIN family toxin of toxin-antitoxin system
MLAEMEDVLSRPKLAQRGINADEVGSLLAVLRSGGALAQVEGTVRVCRDPDDNVVIETAIRGGADVLVSGDHDLTQMVEVAEHLAKAGVRVLTVSQFLQELNKPEETPRA